MRVGIANNGDAEPRVENSPRKFAAIACGLLAAAVATPAAAQDFNVYLGVIRDDVKPIVIYAFSDPASSGFSPVDAAAYYPRPDYKPPLGSYNPLEGCATTRDYDGPFPEEFQVAPIYGPSSGQAAINFIDLPSFMAREAVSALASREMLSSDLQATYYFNCAGFLWSGLLAQPPGVYEELIRKEAERLRGQ